MGSEETKKRLLDHFFEQPKQTIFLLTGIFLIGVLLFMTSRLGVSPVNEGLVSVAEVSVDTLIREEERELELRLEKILSQIQGAGQVEVAVFLAAGTSYEYAINVSANQRVIDEKDQGGGVRLTTENNSSDQYVLIRGNQAGLEQPIIIRETRPQILGVLVVAEGARDAQVKNKLTRAVETALGLEIHRIQVLSRR
ncbi:MAG: hypothetical protein WDA53_00080 [Bacillota bacterium]